MTKLTNCPPDYYSNCSNAGTRCKLCRAGFASKKNKLLYQPIDDSIQPHPDDCIKPDLFKKRRILKKAKAHETTVAKQIISHTLRSGAAQHDGDLLAISSIKIECKQRGCRKSWNLTWDEYQKGQTQGIQVYAVTVTCPDGKPRTLYLLEQDLFGELIHGRNIEGLL
jgi:hypothetical protein